MYQVNSKSYWDEAVECDLCGHFTHGIIYDDEPEIVYCSCCHRPLIGNPTSGGTHNLPLSSTPLHFRHKGSEK